jgi:hypothetical protein
MTENILLNEKNRQFVDEIPNKYVRYGIFILSISIVIILVISLFVKINFNVNNSAIIFSKSDTIFIKTYLQPNYLNGVSKDDTLSIYCSIISNTYIPFKVVKKEDNHILLGIKHIQKNLNPIIITDTIHSQVNIIVKKQSIYKVIFD